MELTFERVFASPGLDGPTPRAVKLSPDGRYLSVLRNREDDRERYDLWAFDRDPAFRAGDTVRVGVKVIEGTRERVQMFEGVVIARSNRSINSNFTVRKMSFGEGVERVFPLYSPIVDSITVVRRGIVRRAKLYYLRGRTGKRARIAERRDNAPKA